jgi:heat shock protein HslJ
MPRILAAAAASVGLAACVAQPDMRPASSDRPAASAAQPSTLVGTRWQLLELRSPDGAIGTVRPADPSRYLLEFAADGGAALRLDCNRGRGRYEATPTGPGRGTLRFGPIAATRAMCPPGSLDARLGRELSVVRTYVLSGEELRLEMGGDGGQQIWRRIPG